MCTGLACVDVLPSPKSQKKEAKLPEAIAVEVAGEKEVPFASQSGFAEKLIMGGGKMPRVCTWVAKQPWSLMAFNVIVNVPLLVYV